MKSTQEGLLASLQRLNSIPDPVLRYGLFLEIMRMFIDIAVTTGRCMLQQTISTAMEDLEDQQAEPNPADGKTLRQRDRSIANAKEKVVMLEQSLGLLENNANEYRKYFDSFFEWIRQGASAKAAPAAIVPQDVRPH